MKQQPKRLGTNRTLSVLRNWRLYIMFLPGFLCLLIFSYYPMYGLQLAFKEYSPRYGITGSPWNNFENFIYTLGSEGFWEMAGNTLSIGVLKIIFAFPSSIILALMLKEIKNEKSKKLIQTVLYAPHFISIVVVCSMISLFFAKDTGFATQLVASVTGKSPEWLTSAEAYPHIYTWSGVWQNLGWNCVIYVAALSGVDPTLHEAATIDGASRLQRIVHINLPSIAPTIIITLILQVGQIMSLGTDKVLLLKNGLNQDTALTIGLFVYERGMVKGGFDYATAVGLFTNVINLILVLSVNWISRKVSKTSLF